MGVDEKIDKYLIDENKKIQDPLPDIIDVFVNWAEDDKLESYPMYMQKRIEKIINPVIKEVEKREKNKKIQYSTQSAISLLRNSAKKLQKSNNEIDVLFSKMLLSDYSILEGIADIISMALIGAL
jgi:hypothetical protein